MIPFVVSSDRRLVDRKIILKILVLLLPDVDDHLLLRVQRALSADWLLLLVRAGQAPIMGKITAGRTRGVQTEAARVNGVAVFLLLLNDSLVVVDVGNQALTKFLDVRKLDL